MTTHTSCKFEVLRTLVCVEDKTYKPLVDIRLR